MQGYNSEKDGTIFTVAVCVGVVSELHESVYIVSPRIGFDALEPDVPVHRFWLPLTVQVSVTGALHDIVVVALRRTVVGVALIQRGAGGAGSTHDCAVGPHT